MDVPTLQPSVHHHETNVGYYLGPAIHQVVDEQTFNNDFRHSGWARIRARTFEALQRCGISIARRARWRMCGQLAWVMRRADITDVFKIHASYCHDRFCRPCTTRAKRRDTGASLPAVPAFP